MLENISADTRMQTPIEIALGIDKEGRTTARKLYEFLELDKRNYSRWTKNNIEKNAFAEENIDFWPFVINDEWGGQATTDYRLTTSFAKKLAMSCHNEKGEAAKEYFIRIEERAKQHAIDITSLSPELQMFKQIFDSVAQTQLEQKRQEKAIVEVNKKVDSIKEIVALNPNSWRKETLELISKIANHLGRNDFIRNVNSEAYK